MEISLGVLPQMSNKIFKLVLLPWLTLTSVNATAENINSVEALVKNPDKFIEKSIRIKGRLQDFPSLYLISGKSKVAVYTLRDMMSLFEEGHFFHNSCSIVEGTFKYSKFHKQYYVEEKVIQVCKR